MASPYYDTHPARNARHECPACGAEELRFDHPNWVTGKPVFNCAVCAHLHECCCPTETL